MTRPACRVFFTEHDDGKVSGVVMRRSERLFDGPPPSAWGSSADEVKAVLAPAVTAIDDDDRPRYLFTEELELRRVAIDVRPRAAAGKAWVVGSRTIPLRLGFAAYAEGKAFRVLVPRFGWSLVLESLDDAGDVLGHAIFASTMGDTPATIFDYRPAVREWIEAWTVPALLEPASRTDDDDVAAVPNLAAVAEEWTAKLARRLLAPTVGEPAAAAEVATALDAEPPRSLLLVGEPGVGKSALVRRAARHLLLASRRDKTKRRLWATSAGAITAGMVYLGMWQERCLAIASELNGTDDWLYVDRLVELLEPQSDGSSIGDLWTPMIAAGELRVIAECSEAELTRARRKHPALVDAFTVLRVDEPAADVVLPMAVAFQQRKDAEVELHPGALRRAFELLGAFRRDQRFPGKLFAFLEWWNQADPRPPRIVRPGDVAAAFARWSGLPIELITDERPAGRADIARALAAGVIGQDPACEVAARALVRFKTGLDDPERPVAALLFAGPTGVGKTELAKQLARYLFGGPSRMVRVDLSEYMTPGSAGRLLEVGRGTTSLAEQVRRQPLSVVLLDELEKAHAEVFDLLLGVLGEGRLTDSMGRLVDFRMTVIVMTSNLGAVGGGVGFGGRGGPDHAAAVRAHFRPELIGRLDHVVGFAPLGRADIERIVELELAKLRQRPGLPQRNLKLWLSPAARAQLADRGHDPKLGARPLRRLIEEQVVAPLAIRLAADPSLRDRSIGVVTAAEAERAPADQLVLALPA
ncbi:MAG TPA: AAA family ATPase [Kofleriaceae bacterium]|nr:AAA family ATPase [Kofleriaceae bacterium]